MWSPKQNSTLRRNDETSCNETLYKYIVMKKNFYLLICLLLFVFCVTNVSASDGNVSKSKGIFLPLVTSVYNGGLQVRVSDGLLGPHESGVTDERSNSFTVSARVLIDSVSVGQLNYSNIPLFGLCVDEAYGINTIADVVIENGAYGVKVNKSIAGSPILGEYSNKVNAIMGEWVSLTMVVDDENAVATLYCNGEVSAQADYGESGALLRDDENAVFHMTNYQSYASLGVRYDEWKIADRALTPEEVASLDYGFSLDNVPEYISGYYTFDETTGVVNEYANMGHGGDFKAQVVTGVPNYNGLGYNPELYTTDTSCDGWTPVYEDKETFVVDVQIEGEGTVVLVDGSGNEYQSGQSFMKDSVVYVVATPAEDYELNEIYVNDVLADNPSDVSFTVSQPTVVKVVFALKGGLVSVADDSISGGTYICVDPATDTEYPKNQDNTYYTIPYGSQVKVKATADDGYKLKSIILSDGENETELDLQSPIFTIDSDVYTLQVNFVARYSVNYSASEGGSIEVRCDGQKIQSGKIVDAGSEVSITVIADTDYVLDCLLVNGESVQPDNGVYIMTIDGDLNIEARFVPQSGLSSVNSASVYYDSTSHILHLGSNVGCIVVYTLGGSVVMKDCGSDVSLSVLGKGCYLVSVDIDGVKRVIKVIR